jgi:ATP adenylyltransferase
LTPRRRGDTFSPGAPFVGPGVADAKMSGFPKNLWAPWRMEYIHSLAEENAGGCFLCRYRDAPERDAAHHVLWRADGILAIMNRFPYTNGHLLIAPADHRADLDDLDDAATAHLWRNVRRAKSLLADALSPHGFNIGINFGLCAGAGLPGHLHVHLVPRWNGDTNFMSVIGDTRIIPQALDRLYEQLRGLAARQGLPAGSGGNPP